MEDSVEASVPMPVGDEISLFKKEVRNAKFNRSGLESFLERVEAELDNVIEMIKTKEFSFIAYDLGILNENDELLGLIVEGGFCYVGDREFNWSINKFQERYKESFSKIRGGYDGSFLRADMYVLGFRDTVTKKVPALNPENPKI